MSKMIVIYNKETGEKTVESDNYNYWFNTKNGQFARWGKTTEDDPQVGYLELFDLEVSEICEGIPKKPDQPATPCSWCYKSNKQVGRNMTIDQFKDIFNKLPQSLAQIALGIGDIWSNPDLVAMLKYCRDNDYNPGVVPNITTNGYGIDEGWVKTLKEHCGGVAVSVYDPKDVAYDAVQKLVAGGITQVTVHQLISTETFDKCKEVIDDAANDPRLKGLKAVLFLTLKPKGKRNKLSILKDVKKYRELIDFATEKGVNIGFDSCSAPIILMAMKGHPDFDQLAQSSESCESNRFHGYANVAGMYWHCSFTEDHPNWEGIDLTKVEDFDRDVWHHPEAERFRHKLVSQDNRHIAKNCYLCPVFSLYDDETIGNMPGTTRENKEIPIRFMKKQQ